MRIRRLYKRAETKKAFILVVLGIFITYGNGIKVGFGRLNYVAVKSLQNMEKTKKVLFH